ncbi:PqiC family protein [bacterium]|nr:PqiC family protein [bacterium]
MTTTANWISRFAAMAAIAALTASLPACFNFQREHKDENFYQIEYEPPAADGVAFPGVVVRVANFDVAAGYQSPQIVYSTSAKRRKVYDYHMWIVNPGDMLTDLLLRDMVASGLYEATIDMRSSIYPDYELEGQVVAIYEKDEPDVWFSVLAVRTALFAYHRGKHVLFQRTYEESIPTAGQTPQHVVAAMSDAARNVSARIQRDVNDAIATFEAKKLAEKQMESAAADETGEAP